VILLEVETVEPLEIEASFRRDFQLEWPGALGGTYIDWNPQLHAFLLGEEQKKFAAFVGSPSATEHRQEYLTNYSSSRENSFKLGITNKGKDTKVIVIAGSVEGRPPAEDTFRHLATAYEKILRESAEYYRNYIHETVNLDLPDERLQQAYDWARISMVQGLVSNPYLGTGLIAGYRTSGEEQRPGFAWFFGRDALWTSFAFNAAGDFASTRAALDFLSRYQREDGKIPHEVSQSATLVDWFKNYPYPYASIDATPLFIIATNDYVTSSGDVGFAKKKWDNLWKAYQFLRSTYDEHGFPQNFGFGHGWVEGGPLLPVKSEFYQSGLGTEALRALSNLAHQVSKDDVSRDLDQAFAKQHLQLNQTFWSPEMKIFAFALDKNNNRVDLPSVLATVPMWFGLADHDKAEVMLDQLSDFDHQADWGMRIISSRDPKYNPGGYHFGSVWPLFTGWASVGEYRYHRANPAYENLRANALLALDGALGHVTEVLSGDYYQPLSTSSPHQIWSAAMVVSPMLRGMLGLDVDAILHRLTFAPHLPADWTGVGVRNLHVGSTILDLTYIKTADGITLKVQRRGPGECTLEFDPAISLRAAVMSAELNGQHIAAQAKPNSEDQHLALQFPVKNDSTLQIRLRNDFAVTATSDLPPLGSGSQGMRIVSESWSAKRDTFTISVSGLAGGEYELAVWNAAEIRSIDGGELIKNDQGQTRVRILFPANESEQYTHKTVTFQFAK
jgi:glycogen debranching enzyme